MPEISIIVPVYNVDKYIKACLNSLINQTLSDIEIICIDDGSTDSSGTILDKYANQDARIKIIHQKNGGLSCARNKGIELAKSPRIMFCDSDDWIESKMCERLLSIMISEKVDLVACNSIIEVDSRQTIMNGVGGFSPVPTGKYRRLENIFFALNGSVCTCIFLKKLIDQYSINFEKNSVIEDYVFTRKYLLVCETFYILKDKLYHYVMRKGSLIDQWTSTTRGPIPPCIRHAGDYKYICFFCRNNGIYDKYSTLLTFNYVLSIVYHWRLLPDNLKEEYLKEAKKTIDSLKISEWGSPKNNQLIRAIQKEDYALAQQRLKYWPYQTPMLWWIYGRLVIYRLFNH